MAFDWLNFFDRYGIAWYKSTPGNVTIRCPLCPDDPSHHLSVSLAGRGYMCFRNEAHRGRSAAGLVMLLLNCSHQQAEQIVGKDDVVVPLGDGDFADNIGRLLGTRLRLITAPPPPSLEFPEEFHSLFRGVSKKLFVPYMRTRGYTTDEVEWLEWRFKLKCALRGPFAYRVIMPVYVDRALVTWTGRTIANDKLRYKTLTSDRETAAKSGLPAAIMSVKDTLFDFDEINKPGEWLIITEGPFDAMRITFFGDRYDTRGTCLFGKMASIAQRAQIDGLIPLYRSVVCLLDSDAGLSVSPFGDSVKSVRLPEPFKDPAELTRAWFDRLFP